MSDHYDRSGSLSFLKEASSADERHLSIYTNDRTVNSGLFHQHQNSKLLIDGSEQGFSSIEGGKGPLQPSAGPSFLFVWSRISKTYPKPQKEQTSSAVLVTSWSRTCSSGYRESVRSMNPTDMALHIYFFPTYLGDLQVKFPAVCSYFDEYTRSNKLEVLWTLFLIFSFIKSLGQMWSGSGKMKTNQDSLCLVVTVW